jgi:putative transposase
MRADKYAFMNRHPQKPHRLSSVFQCYDPPLYFITFCTKHRKKLLHNNTVHLKFKQFIQKSNAHGAAIGRDVIMPDHIHCFIRIAPHLNLGTTVRLLKRSLSSVIETPAPHWQPGYFDHVLRHRDSYSEKWDYVVRNPVRAGLATQPEEWPFQGEGVSIRC